MLCMRRQQAYGRLQLVPNNLNGFVRLFAYTVRAVPEFDQFPLTIRHDAICPSVRFLYRDGTLRGADSLSANRGMPAGPGQKAPGSLLTAYPIATAADLRTPLPLTSPLSRSRSRRDPCWWRPKQNSPPQHPPKKPGFKREPKYCVSGSRRDQQDPSPPNVAATTVTKIGYEVRPSCVNQR